MGDKVQHRGHEHVRVPTPVWLGLGAVVMVAFAVLIMVMGGHTHNKAAGSPKDAPAGIVDKQAD